MSLRAAPARASEGENVREVGETVGAIASKPSAADHVVPISVCFGAGQRWRLHKRQRDTTRAECALIQARIPITYAHTNRKKKKKNPRGHSENPSSVCVFFSNEIERKKEKIGDSFRERGIQMHIIFSSREVI